MKKKYFFFDIDGTLTDEATHRIVPSALETIRKLETNGHFVSVATGRMHYKTISFTDSIGMKNLVCAGGGCLVVNGEVRRNLPLDHDQAIQLLETADAKGIGWILILEDTDAVWMRDFRFLEQAGLRRELTSYCYDPALDYHVLPQILKIYLALDKEGMRENPWASAIGCLSMGRYHVIQYDAKKQGILDMMELLKADPADVVVFGNDTNDLVMFDPAWTSIAMGNSPDILKEKADYVTDANTEDGIRKACLHFGWIE